MATKYKAHKNLSIGIKAGEIFDADRIRPQDAEILLEKGIISVVRSRKKKTEVDVEEVEDGTND